MVYRVKITRAAINDADEAYTWIAKESVDRAANWLDGLFDAVSGLAVFPERCQAAAETADMPIEVRQLLYGKRMNVYRILFSIDEGSRTVTVLRIRHSARLSLGVSDDPGTA